MLDIYKIKQDVKTLTAEITDLKKLKQKYDRLNYSYSSYDLEHDKRWWWRGKKAIRICHKNQFITVESAASITNEMIEEQKVNNVIYWNAVNELNKKQYIIRHLFIVYGQFRGKTREQIEPKYAERKSYSHNLVTGKSVLGNDPIDWAFIWELKKGYLPQAEERP